jgi:hypothetical protein
MYLCRRICGKKKEGRKKDRYQQSIKCILRAWHEVWQIPDTQKTLEE